MALRREDVIDFVRACCPKHWATVDGGNLATPGALKLCSSKFGNARRCKVFFVKTSLLSPKP